MGVHNRGSLRIGRLGSGTLPEGAHQGAEGEDAGRAANGLTHAPAVGQRLTLGSRISDPSNRDTIPMSRAAGIS